MQDNHSLSHAVGTLRGLHFQALPAAQGKLVRCGRGAIFDVAVDIRRGSPTYGQWEGYELSAENGHQLYVPVGFAHGFVTLEPDSEIVYKCTDYYAPETEGTVRWDSCGIEWPLSGDPILSDKDAIAPALADLDSPFVYGEIHEDICDRRGWLHRLCGSAFGDCPRHSVVNVDAMTYAACLENVASVVDHPNYMFEQVDIRYRADLEQCSPNILPMR